MTLTHHLIFGKRVKIGDPQCGRPDVDQSVRDAFSRIDTLLMLYARDLSTRELQAFLEERYQVPVSPDLISPVTHEVLAEVEAWQQRLLEPPYVAVVFDALRVKIRDEGVVRNQAVYLALGVQPDGTKVVLGF